MNTLGLISQLIGIKTLRLTNTIDEARDEESELGFKNNGVRDEARDEEKSF